MRTSILLITYAFATASSAQLVNGSFEINGNPSLDGWEWTCGDPELVPDAATNAGIWSATKQPGHAKGCFPSYLFQRLSNVQNGDNLFLSGWVKCPEFGPCQGGFIGLGRVNNGEFELEETASAQELAWTFISISDTVEIGPGDTAIVVLNSGFVGGPAFVDGTAFDGIEVSLPLHMNNTGAPTIQHLLDRGAGTLSVSAGKDRIIDLLLYDLTGRSLPVRRTARSINAITVDLSSVPGGVYFAAIRTERGARTIRFSTW